MSENNLYSLIHRLHQQHPVNTDLGITACPSCGEPAYNSDLCADCLVLEIEAVTQDSYHPERYRTQLALQQFHLQSMVERVENNGGTP